MPGMAIFQFIRERFQLKATIAISMTLFTAPFLLVEQPPINWFIGIAATFLILLGLRCADDLTSLEEDAVSHPERGLITGKINKKDLAAWLICLQAIVFLISTAGPQKIIYLIMVFYYAVFFLLKKTIAFILRPFFSNAIFLFLPYYATIADTVHFNHSIASLGLFSWAGAIAHEFAHNVHGPGENRTILQSYQNLIGAQNTSILSFSFFLLAIVFAWFFWNFTKQPHGFIAFLILASLYLGYLYCRLFNHPCNKNAKAFYISGFAFFLLPQCAFIVDTFLTGINR